MRILHVYDLGPYDNGVTVGGIENHIFSLLGSLAKRDHECYFLTGAIPGEFVQDSISGVKIIRTDFFSLVKRTWTPYNLRFARELAFLAAGLRDSIKEIPRVDLVHGHIYSAGLIAAIISKMQGIPCVCTLHGSYYGHWAEIMPGIVRPALFSAFERFLLPFLGKLADFQVHTDFFFAKKALEWGVPRNKLAVILNSVDPIQFHPGVKPVQVSLPNPRIMTVRRLVPKNGVHVLVKAFSQVLKKYSTAQLLIVGDGPQRLYLESLVNHLHLSNSVHFIGRISNARIPEYLAAADAVVVPSLVEASSISLLEAMSMEKPCIATKIPGIDLVSDSCSVEGCLANDPLSLSLAILKILDKPDYATFLSKNARQRILRQHGLEKMTRMYERLYNALIQ